MLATILKALATAAFIAVLSVRLGRWMLGVEGKLHPHLIFEEFTRASGDLWNNVLAPFTDRSVHWQNFDHFWDNYFLPYVVGGIGPVQQRGIQPLGGAGFEIGTVGLRNGGALAVQLIGDGEQRGVLLRRARPRQRTRGGTGALAQIAHVGSDVGNWLVAHLGNLMSSKA